MAQSLDDIEFLKPCPFCGSQPEVTIWEGRYIINCPCCLIRVIAPFTVIENIPLDKAYENAVKAWNRRG